MISQTYIPRFPLNQFVDYFFFYEGYNPSHSVDRFLPDENVELIIDLHDSPKFIYDNETFREIQACHHVWASGVRTEPISIDSGKAAAMIVVHFKKGLAYPFFPVPMDEISDCVVDADLLWGSWFGTLRERPSGKFFPIHCESHPIVCPAVNSNDCARSTNDSKDIGRNRKGIH